ncbi:hypothetical protein [Citreimonas salinaria]|uniref:Peptidyl-prolyl cis-trans isomerase SurA n=1 Tax=Citreimonas salinaria TaxID=321339 RepID=A0A1H3NKX3_9RHOB|nr:hypothetical protein [Citreimonas salinaria]SDY89454.1 hypothetical protein SAMN05444340_1265 [Citreimonas salinaria]
MSNYKMRDTAIAAILSIPVASGAAFAQESNQTNQSGAGSQSSDSATQQSTSGNGQAGGTQQNDPVVAAVAGTEIFGSDVMKVIGALPPELSSQPSEMLVPMALEQLILRQLIVNEARSQNFDEDPEVVALVETSMAGAEDDALVQVWLDRQMANAVSDEAVQQTYDQAVAQGQQNMPPLAEVRPQIEQFLSQQAMLGIRTQLTEGADVVFFDPAGNPIDPQSGGRAQGSASTQEGSAEGDVSADMRAAIEDAVAARDVTALYDAWAGEDEMLTVSEWDAVVDQVFGEDDVNLAVTSWDDDSNEVISRMEFNEAVAEDDLLDTVLR